MRTKPAAVTVARPRGTSDNHARPARRPAPGRAPALSTSPGILDAVRDQHGGYWIRYGSGDRSFWFSLTELQQAPREVFSRLSGPGMTFLTDKSQRQFKELIEAREEYRDALVASRPGWTENHYVFGDGEVFSPPGNEREFIRVFELDPKFAPAGTLADWQADIGPVVTEQSLLLFALAFSFIGPLLRFAPPHVLNPLVELVGGHESGKSTVGALSASVWAGNPNSDAGGGETWDLTLNAIDGQKRRHADGHLVLDEGNLAGSSRQQQKELVERAVFKFAGTGQKRWYGDPTPVDHVRLTMLSTTNVPLAELVDAPAAIRGALQSRMITVEVKGEHGVLTSVPLGFASPRAAMEHLRTAVDANFGVAGREFIRRLVGLAARREEELRQAVQRRADHYLAQVGAEGTPVSARVAKTFALAFVAGSLAQKWGIIPEGWGKLLPAIRDVNRSVQSSSEPQPRQAALARVQDYAQRHLKDLIEVASLRRPLAPEDFDAAVGFRRKVNGHLEVLIPAARFQREFPDHVAMMRELRGAGLAKTEGGDQPKLTIKVPSAICGTGRVYCVVIGTTTA